MKVLQKLKYWLFGDGLGGFLVIDGPEKAGKSYTIKQLKKVARKHFRRVKVVKWTEPAFDDFMCYHRKAEKHLKFVKRGGLVIWDRSYLSEVVYGGIFPAPHRVIYDDLVANVHKVSWILRSFGVQYCLLGPNIERLVENRDSTDLPVHPRIEVREYEYWARKFGWMTVYNQHNPQSLQDLMTMMISDVKAAAQRRAAMPAVLGDASAKTLIITRRGVTKELLDLMPQNVFNSAVVSYETLSLKHIQMFPVILMEDARAAHRSHISRIRKMLGHRPVTTFVNLDRYTTQSKNTQSQHKLRIERMKYV